MSWGAIGTQQTRSSVQWIHTDKICFLHVKHSLRKPPPHAFGSHKVIKSAIVQQCCRRSKCCDLIFHMAWYTVSTVCKHSTWTSRESLRQAANSRRFQTNMHNSSLQLNADGADDEKVSKRRQCYSWPPAEHMQLLFDGGALLAFNKTCNDALISLPPGV